MAVPVLADLLGKLVINDLKSAAHDQLVKPQAVRRPIYTVFDEFSVLAGEQVWNVISMGRSAGLHAVLVTQSVADIGRAVPMAPDHFGTIEASGDEIGIIEAGTAKVGTAQASTAKVGIAEVGTSKFGSAEVDTTEVGTTEANIAEIGLAEVSLAEVSTTEV